MKKRPKASSVILVLFICCAFFAGSCSSRPGKGDPGGRSGPGGPGGEEKRFISTVFDTRSFNVNADKLQPMYTGHNPELLYNSILKRKENAKRGPKETEQQYETRIGLEISLPLMGAMDFNSVYAFRITPKEVRYNERDGAIQVRCPLLPVFEKGGVSGDKRSFMVRYQPQLDNRYTITGSGGARIEVEEIKFLEHAVAAANIKDFPVETTLLPDVRKEGKEENAPRVVNDDRPNRENIAATIKMTPEDAKKFEGGIMALLVCKLAEPYTSYEEIRRAPTSEKPGVYVGRYRYVHVMLFEIWFYDIMSGKIFKKMHARTKSAPYH